MRTYFGFGVAPSMFPGDCTIRKEIQCGDQAREILAGAKVSICLNPSHKASIDAMKTRFGIAVEIPAQAPTVALLIGDRILVMGVSGLPRLEHRHEYTTEEIEKASFVFSLWTVSE